jgi:hypothetical protein
MKHSAKAVAKLAREREKQARHTGTVAGGSVPSHQAPGTGPPMTRPDGPVDDEHAGGFAPVVATAGPGVSEPRLARHRLAQLPYALVLAGVLLGLVLMRGGLQAVRGGTLVIASALLAGSLTRLLLPDGRAGLLGSRRRLVDVALLTALGVGLLIAGLIVKVPS